MLQIKLKSFFRMITKFKVNPHTIETDKDFFKKMTKSGDHQQMGFYSLNKSVHFWEVHFFTT